MTDAELENYMAQTITMKRSIYFEDLERARQNGLKIGMLVGRQNAEYEGDIKQSRAIRKACDSFEANMTPKAA